MNNTTTTAKTLKVGNYFIINANTAQQKAVQAFSAKQASVCFCKGGQPRGNQVITLDGVHHTDNQELAVDWSRYNQLLTALSNAVELTYAQFDMTSIDSLASHRA